MFTGSSSRKNECDVSVLQVKINYHVDGILDETVEMCERADDLYASSFPRFRGIVS